MFIAKPTIYSTTESKVQYASSWLTGAASRYYQNMVDKEIGLGVGAYLPALHEWEAFLQLFGKMFGLHDEQLASQAALDNVIQKTGESFADFLVRFDDASLKAEYNEQALRFRLLKQIHRDLRNCLTNVGRIPEGYDDVVDRLLDLDGAREAFEEAGLSTPYTWYANTGGEANKNSTESTPAAAGPGPQTQNNYNNRYNRYNNVNRNPNAPRAQAKLAEVDPVDPQQDQLPISKEERNRRMREGLCIRCGKPGHYGRDHDKSKGASLRGASIDLCSCEDCDEECTCCNGSIDNDESIEAKAAFTMIDNDEDISLILELEQLELQTQQGN